jgi:pimeloyl-ACP methyl ester carboxylesterase
VNREPRGGRRPRPLLAALAGLVTLLTGGCGGGADPAAPGSAGGTALAWEDCGDDLECATLPVPLDHDRPDGERIELALARLPARSPEQRIGALLFNPGGPGESGVDVVREAGEEYFDTALRDRFDIVGFDPRGVGASAPVRCTEGDDERAADDLELVPTTPRARDRMVAEARAFVAGCQRLSGHLLPHVSTEATARDLDLLRAALGEERLTYLGVSYGTLLGAVYADLYPERTRAMVLDAAADPVTWFGDGAEVARQQTLGFERSLDAFSAACARNPDSCPLGADPEAALDRLLARLERTPLEVGDEEQVDEVVAFDAVVGALYDDRAWPLLADALARAESGDGAALLELAATDDDAGPDGRVGNAAEAQAAITCADRDAPGDVQAYHELARELARIGPRFGPVLAYAGLDCAFWPVDPAPRDGGAITAEGAPPLLVIGGTRDPATPYAEAQAMAGQLASAVLLTLEGDGHGAYGGRSACVDDAVHAYLLRLTTPVSGTVCRPS